MTDLFRSEITEEAESSLFIDQQGIVIPDLADQRPVARLRARSKPDRPGKPLRQFGDLRRLVTTAFAVTDDDAGSGFRKDTGDGISDDILPNIFKKGHSGDGGSGL